MNPLLTWRDIDVREKSHKLSSVEVPTRDQLLTKVDLSIQYRLDASMAPLTRSTSWTRTASSRCR